MYKALIIFLSMILIIEFENHQVSAEKIIKKINVTYITLSKYLSMKDRSNIQPVLPKCCDNGEKLVENPKNNKSVCTKDDSLNDVRIKKSIYISNTTGIVKFKNYTSMYILTNSNCKKYALDPETSRIDKNYLLINGQLYLPNVNKTTYKIGEYCVDFYQSGNDTRTETFICFSDQYISAVFRLYPVGLLISVPFLIITAMVYTFIPELNDLQGKCLSLYSGCLAVAFLALAVVQLIPDKMPDNICITAAYIIQFFFVSCFFWLNSMCFEMWFSVKYYLRFSAPEEDQQKRFIKYSIYCWSSSLLLLIVTSIVEVTSHPLVKPKFVENCWFYSDDGLNFMFAKKGELIYFYGPVSVIIMINCVLFILTSKELTRSLNRTNEVVDITRQPRRFSRVLSIKLRWKNYKKMFSLYGLLFIIMGLSWVMEILTWAIEGKKAIWNVFDLINAFQGITIFGMFVCESETRGLIIHRFRSLFHMKKRVNLRCQRMTCRRNTYLTILSFESLNEDCNHNDHSSPGVEVTAC